MTVKMKQILPPEIDTKMDVEKPHQGHGHAGPNGMSFREADTPQHSNKGDKSLSGSVPPFQPQAYSHYPPPGPQGSHNRHMPNNYYGRPPAGLHPSGHSQSVMVSPGGSTGYNNWGYYPPHHNNGAAPPPYPYGNQGQVPYNGRYPAYGDMNGRPHPSYNPHVSYQNQANASLEFSRAVSSSFGDNNKNKASPASFQNDHNDRNDRNEDLFDTRDDISIGAESDSSWKQLNQVASIEEDKFCHEDGRFGATTPVDRICPTLSSDMSSSPAIAAHKLTLKMGARRSVTSLLSVQEPLDTSNSKDDLDLRLCSTGSSGLLFYDESSAAKRTRGNEKESTRAPSPSTNFGNLSMKEERDAPPSKRRCSSIAEEREIYSKFSIDSMDSFGKDGGKLPALGAGKNSHTGMHRGSDSDRDDCERDLPTHMPSWDITGQDSFGGGFSVASNLTDGQEDALGNSFSFSNDHDFPPANASDENNGISKDLEKADALVDSLHPTESIDLNRPPDAPPRGTYPPAAATWVTNNSSQGGSFSMDSQPPHISPRFPHPPPPHGRYGNMPPPYSGGYPPRPPGSFGMSRPPHAFLPPSFQPPPAGMAGPPMNRNAPQPVYMMSSPPGGPGGVHGIKSSSSKLNNKGGPNWSKVDDQRLQDILKKFKNPKDWEAVAKDFGAARTAKECNERWIRYLKPGVRKGQWQDHEDAIVIEAVTTCKEQPFTRWSDLAQKLPGRVGKQIRDRWVNHLNPNINHLPFSKEDDNLLWDGHKQLGKRWVEISTKFFNQSRSENHIKNRWYSASFKKFVSTEFGPNAYVPCDKKHGKIVKGIIVKGKK